MLSKEPHVPTSAAFAKTAFSNSIVPHSTRLSFFANHSAVIKFDNVQ